MCSFSSCWNIFGRTISQDKITGQWGYTLTFSGRGWFGSQASLPGQKSARRWALWHLWLDLIIQSNGLVQVRVLPWSAVPQNQSLARTWIFNPAKAATNFGADHYSVINTTYWLRFPNKLIVMSWPVSRSTLHHKCNARGLWIWAGTPKSGPAQWYSHCSLWIGGKPALGVSSASSIQLSSTIWNLTYPHITGPGVKQGFLEVLCHIYQPHAGAEVLESLLKVCRTALGTHVWAAEPVTSGQPDEQDQPWANGRIHPHEFSSVV